MSIIEAPVSSIRRQETEARIQSLINKQEEEAASRIAANKKHAAVVSEKIIKEFSKNQAAENKKLADSSAFYVPEESQFFVVMQIRSQNKMPPKPRKVLELLRLKSINSAVIVRNNLSIKNMLQKAKDYIAYGTISYDLLREMVYLRGHGKIGSSKVKLTNENIETAFDGKYRCVEELLDVIYNGKEDIKQVLNFLYPFSLNCPKGGFKGEKKSMPFLQGGSTGNHMELIGDLLKRMLY
ncbi:large subunit ribosomal protein L7e [Enteropsectra breve]|nr:large subunit ribosomal protein L7e [Enteropsectra breve]